MSDTEQRYALEMRALDKDEPGLIRERDGTVWVVEADGTRTQLPGAGGGSQPSTFARASYSGGTVTIANNGNVRLTWTTLGQGNALLDLSDPEAPTVVAGGIYSITATIVCLDFLTSGGCFKATLHLDAQNEDAVCIMTGGNQLAGDQDAYVSINNSYYIPAGGEISVSIVNKDGSASRDFTL